MRRRWSGALLGLTFALAAATPALAAAEPSKPGIYHRYVMKGSLMEVDDEGIYLCVGTKDGAVAGQQIDVFRYSRHRGANPKSGVRFRREKVGRIEILEVVDEHFARAKPLEGKLKEGDMAELEEPGS